MAQVEPPFLILSSEKSAKLYLIILEKIPIIYSLSSIYSTCLILRKSSKETIMLRKAVFILLALGFICVIAYSQNPSNSANKNAETHYSKAQKFVEKKKFDAAVEEFKTAIGMDSNYVDAWAQLGQLYYYSGLRNAVGKSWSATDPMWGQADQALSRAIELGCEEPLVYSQRGKIRFHRGPREGVKRDFEHAIQKYDSTISLNPDLPANYVGRSFAYCNLWWLSQSGGKQDSLVRLNALNDLLIARRLKPDYLEAYKSLGWFYDLDRQRDSAIVAYTRCIELDPKDAEIFYNRARDYNSNREYDKAIADYTQAIKLIPDNGRFYSERASVYANSGKKEEASQDYNKAIELQPENANGYRTRGFYYVGQNNYDAAIKDFSTAIDLGDWRSIGHRGHCYIDKGEYDSAMADFNSLAEKWPTMGQEGRGETPNPFRGRGQIYAIKKDFDAAINACTEALKYQPNWDAIYSDRAGYYVQKGDYERAIPDLTKCIQLRPKSADYCNARGDVYMNSGKLDQATQDVDKALELDPKHYDATITRGEIYTRQGEYSKALNQISRAISLHSDWSSAYYYRALTYKAMGNTSKAIDDLKKCIELGGYQDAKEVLVELEK